MFMTLCCPQGIMGSYESKYISKKSKITQQKYKIQNYEYSSRSQVIINSQEGNITGMAGANFKKEGTNCPELVRQVVFGQMRGKHNLSGKGNSVKQPWRWNASGMPRECKTHQPGQQQELSLQPNCGDVENQADEFGFSLICTEVTPKIFKPKGYEERAVSTSRA